MAETENSKIIGGRFPLLYDESLPAVRASAVARITGVGIGTINVWINRGVLFDVELGVQGRARNFDASLVVHLAVMSALVRLGYPALTASLTALEAFQQGPHPREPGVLLVVKAAPPGDTAGALSRQPVHVVQRSPLSSLEETIGVGDTASFESFTVVDLSAIWKRVKDEIETAAEENRP